jgi:CrcB protein
VEIIVIAIGGAFGAVARYWLTELASMIFGATFPYGTLIVNVLGSLLLGFVFVFFVERSLLAPLWRSAVMIGFLGAFTTFSTFSLQAFDLIQHERYLAGGIYIVSSVVISLLAIGIGMAVAKQF